MEYRHPLVLKDVFYDTYTHTIYYKKPPKGQMEDPYCKRNLLLKPATKEILGLPYIPIPGYTYGMEQIHYCFGHAYADTTLPLISVLEEVNTKATRKRDWHLFIFRHEFFYTNHHAKDIIVDFQSKHVDLEGHTYKGPFRDLQQILTTHPVLFEDFYPFALFHFDTLVLGGLSEHQRSIHNHISKYPHRRSEPPVFTDKEIQNFIAKGKNHIARTLSIPGTVPKERSKIQVLLINRRHNRGISEHGIALIRAFFQTKGAPYEIYGPFYLEDLSLTQQITIFLQADFIISPHGSALFHLIWPRPHSILLELFQTKDARDIIFQSYARANTITYARYVEDHSRYEVTDESIKLTIRIIPALEQLCAILDRNQGNQ